MKQLYKQWREGFPVEVRSGLVWMLEGEASCVPSGGGSLTPPPEEAPTLRTTKDETIHLSVEGLA